jgi:hypothetical protein
MNKILIAHEKHGDRYFDASTKEATDKAAFKLLKERFEDSDYWYYVDDEPEKRDMLTDEQIAALPTESFRDTARHERKVYERCLKNWQRQKKQYDSIKDCVENNKIKNALSLLHERSDGEYENISIETLETV